MAKYHKPVAGSRCFWPRKRAKRFYPRMKFTSVLGPMGIAGYAAYKAGMTHVSLINTKKGSATEGKEITRPVTVFDCPPLAVAGVKAYKRVLESSSSYALIWADSISKDLKRKTSVPASTKSRESVEKLGGELADFSDVRLLVHTRPRETGFGKKKPELFEVPLSGTISEKWEFAKARLGGEIRVSDVFKEGEYVDVRSVSKGKGVQGPVARFHVKIRSRKNKKKRRHIGCLGPRDVARVRPNTVAYAGQMGFQTRTEFSKKIIKIGKDGIAPKGGFINYGSVKRDYLLLEGSVPGPKKRLVMMRRGLRAPKKQEPSEVRNVYLYSQQ